MFQIALRIVRRTLNQLIIQNHTFLWHIILIMQLIMHINYAKRYLGLLLCWQLRIDGFDSK